MTRLSADNPRADSCQVPADTMDLHLLPTRRELCEQLFSRISEISSLPALAMRIFDVAANPHSGADELGRLVESDPALAARIVRTANSAFYGLRRQVGNLRTAIALLGFKEVRNLALTIYVSGLFREAGGYGCYDRQALWQHLVGVATVARLVARRLEVAGPEEAYLAGLLHDVGYVLLDHHVHPGFCRVLDLLSDDVPSREIEEARLGFNHAELGAYVAYRWRFPEPLCAAIRYHHAPEEALPQHGPLAAVVAVANYVCCRRGVTSLGVQNVGEPSAHALAALGIDPGDLGSLATELDEVLAAALAMIAI